ncbi:MAG TPA: GNAT family N-acetyltransferase [Rubrobacteraceae bacterium]|nr:GNAT family N-acetyltransferase [Rubrobacteraceae bacterium]
MTEIETARLFLRQWRQDDLDAYACICVDPRVVPYLPSNMSREQSQEQIARFVCHWEERGFGL